MYAAGWIAVVALSVGASLAALLWALGNGQFTQQGRARYLPLRDQDLGATAEKGPRRPVELWALGLVVAVGILGAICAVLLSLCRLKG
jgi:nitrogen fixation-related uncharacterized protein